MWTEILTNLASIGYAMLIFVCAYLANMAFSLWYNIESLKQSFEKSKMIKGIVKGFIFIIGLSLLCGSITTLPIFANEIGWTIPDEYIDVFSNLVIVAAVLVVSAKYIKEAYQKFVKILNGDKE